MPRARTVRGRLRQCELWARSNHSGLLLLKVSVGATRYGHAGVTTTHDSGLVTIRLNRALLAIGNPDGACEVFLHEYAHYLTAAPHRIGDPATFEHDEVWGAIYGRLYRDWFDDGGDEDSCEFSSRHWR